MSEEEYNKILEELSNKRFSDKRMVAIKPSGSVSLSGQISGGINMDFASLYPSTQRMHFPTKQSRRKKKIKRVFDLQNPN